MSFDLRQMRAGERDFLGPDQIANHPLFTAREKLALLEELKGEVIAARENDHDIGLDPDDIDIVIEEVKLGAENGHGNAAVAWGNS